MQSDKLIKKLLKAAAVCEAVYFVPSFIIMFLSKTLLRVYGGIIRVEKGFGETFKLFLPGMIRLILVTAAFYGLWYLFQQAADPKKYSKMNGILLIVLYVFGIISDFFVSTQFNYSLSHVGVENLNYIFSIKSVVSILGILNSAALIMLWIVLGMEWYRSSLIREQEEAARKAAEENAAVDTASTAAADNPENDLWESYRSSLINEQADERTPQEYNFTDKR